jgi:transcriptional regulator with XRE-family HTH domain
MYGEKIRRYRKEAKLSQAELGTLTDTPQTSVSTWESAAYPPLDFIVKTLKVLKPDMMLWEFFVTEEERPRNCVSSEISRETLELLAELQNMPAEFRRWIYDIILGALKMKAGEADK